MEFRPQQIVKVNSFLWNFVYLGNKREAFLVSIWYRCIPVEHFLIKQTKDWYKIDFVKFGFLQSHFFWWNAPVSPETSENKTLEALLKSGRENWHFCEADCFLCFLQNELFVWGVFPFLFQNGAFMGSWQIFNFLFIRAFAGSSGAAFFLRWGNSFDSSSVPWIGGRNRCV